MMPSGSNSLPTACVVSSGRRYYAVDRMPYSQLHYLPLNPLFFAILVGIFFIVLALIELGLLRYAYMRLGVSSRTALVLLFASLIGSYFNIPVWHLPAEQA